MDEVRFTVEGSRGDPYEVVISRRGANITALCSCPAGQNGLWCKHRLALLNGVTDAIVEGSAEDLATVASWLRGSDVEAALERLNAAEMAHADAKRALDAAKRALSRALLT